MSKQTGFAHDFYTSWVWELCRMKFAKSKGHICERCGELGTQVHHKIRLTPENINDPAITLNWDNLELLCDDCHHKEHKKKMGRRWTVDDDGRVDL